MVISLLRPSYKAGFARNASESANPHLWRGLVSAFIPSLGVTGNVIRNVSVNKRDAVFVNMDITNWVIGEDGYSLDYNGLDEQVLIDFPLILGNPNMTVFTKIHLGSVSESGAFVKIGDASTGHGLGVGGTRFDNTGNNIIALYEQRRWISTNVLIGTGWHDVALVIDSSGFPSISLDGEEVYSDTIGAPQPLDTNSKTNIGGYTVSDRFVKASIELTYIYNRALSLTAIKQLHIDPLAPFRQRDRFRGLSIPPVNQILGNPKNRILQHLLTR